MIGHSVTPRITSRLGASSSQAMRASCLRRDGSFGKGWELMAMVKSERIELPQFPTGGFGIVMRKPTLAINERNLFSGCQMQPTWQRLHPEHPSGILHTRQGFLNGELERRGGLIVIGYGRPFIGIGELRQEGRHRDRVGGGGGFQGLSGHHPGNRSARPAAFQPRYLVCTSLLAR